MIKIRTKLLIHFAAILFIIVVLFYVHEQSSQKVIQLYNDNVEPSLLLNEITKQANETFQSLKIYVYEPWPENLSLYQEDKQQLIRLQQEFKAKKLEGILSKNFLNTMSSFLKELDETVEGVEKQDIQRYSSHLNEAEKTASYIQESSFDLINKELSDYQTLSLLIDKKIKNRQMLGTTIILSIIILSILFALWFSNGITRTIERLTWAAKEIAAGRYSGKDVIVSRKDELWFLTKTFNEMKKNILESVSEIEEKARLAQLLKEMELKSLQNQINPHFLFNTLNSISKLSYIEGAERTSDLIASVSALLRYNIGNLDRQTTIKDEVEIVKEYFTIQKTRFGDRVEFLQNVDSSCLSTPIPCLTLQPLIENAFMHGIENMAGGARIELHIYKDNQMVCIDVKDNGAGMEQATIDRLLDLSNVEKESVPKKESGHSTGIGMRNVMDRLRLFHKDSKINISSSLGKGTIVSIQINNG